MEMFTESDTGFRQGEGINGILGETNQSSMKKKKKKNKK